MHEIEMKFDNNFMQNTIGKKGVYFLYDENKELIYIGKTTNVFKRLYYHEVSFKYYSFIEINNDVGMEEIESFMIQKYCPKRNKHYNPLEMRGKMVPNISHDDIKYNQDISNQQYEEIYNKLHPDREYYNKLRQQYLKIHL